MPNFSPTRPGSVWSLLTTLGSAEMADIDAKLVKAINGAEGGTYAPTDAGGIAIGGKGLHLGTTTLGFYHSIAGTGELRWESGTTLRGVISSVMNWQGSATFTLAPTFSNGFNANGTAQCNAGLEVTNAVPSALDLAATSTIAMAQDCSITLTGTSGHVSSIVLSNVYCLFQNAGDSGLYGNSFVAPAAGKYAEFGSVAGTEDLRLKAALVSSGAGRVTKRVLDGPDAATNVRADEYDVVIVRSGALTASRGYDLKTAGAQTGDVVTFATFHAGHALTVGINGVLNISMLPVGAGDVYSVEYTFMSGSWYRTKVCVLPLRRSAAEVPRRVVHKVHHGAPVRRRRLRPARAGHRHGELGASLRAVALQRLVAGVDEAVARQRVTLHPRGAAPPGTARSARNRPGRTTAGAVSGCARGAPRPTRARPVAGPVRVAGLDARGSRAGTGGRCARDAGHAGWFLGRVTTGQGQDGQDDHGGEAHGGEHAAWRDGSQGSGWRGRLGVEERRPSAAGTGQHDHEHVVAFPARWECGRLRMVVGAGAARALLEGALDEGLLGLHGLGGNAHVRMQPQ